MEFFFGFKKHENVVIKALTQGSLIHSMHFFRSDLFISDISFSKLLAKVLAIYHLDKWRGFHLKKTSNCASKYCLNEKKLTHSKIYCKQAWPSGIDIGIYIVLEVVNLF